jgi:stage II sporulation protein D
MGTRWRRSIAVMSLAILALTGCAGPARPRVTPARPAPAALPGIIHVRTLLDGQRQVLALPLEDYVLAAVLSEVAPASGEPDAMRRMFAVQAIVARTYAAAHVRRHATEGFDVCDGTHCQLVDLERPRTSRWAPIARDAVHRTRSVVVRHGGKPAATLFHADCGGHRSAAADVWGGPAGPYLRGGPDPLPHGQPHGSWRFAIDTEKLRQALNAFPQTVVGARLDSIEVHRRDAAGRAMLVSLNGSRAPLVRGEDLRAAVSRAFGPRALRSSLFEVRREKSMFFFEGRGFGHGAGLCQAGAMARAAAGQSPERILAFYFPGTTLSGR